MPTCGEYAVAMQYLALPALPALAKGVHMLFETCDWKCVLTKHFFSSTCVSVRLHKLLAWIVLVGFYAAGIYFLL